MEDYFQPCSCKVRLAPEAFTALRLPGHLQPPRAQKVAKNLPKTCFYGNKMNEYAKTWGKRPIDCSRLVFTLPGI